MAVKVWNVGDVLAAADMNTWTVPIVGLKSANQTITSQITFVNDADMRFAVAANATYEFHVYMRFSSPHSPGDFQTSLTVPAGADARFQRIGNDQSAIWGSDTEWTAAGAPTGLGRGVGTIVNAQLFGVVFTAGTAGTLIFQWAQSTSAGGATVLYANSFLTGRRIA